eukprot:TRINITY_DN77692_c0_g1_i1.p1 TRINITY_DN77692_c0_g1~~TRINITY_DN77692_c0_g1_i1.p1  ORF type:complete len:355 (-),score=37.51 TRINITY_DN77692_c0_g1_i1:41-1105(-)
MSGSAQAQTLSGPTPIVQAVRERKLEGCRKHKQISFSPTYDSCGICGWIRTTFSLWGRPIRPMLVPLFIVNSVAVCCTLATETEVLGGYWQLTEPQKLSSHYSNLFISISFLMVFRLNRAAVRFYEARTAAGTMVVGCRELTSEACTFFDHDKGTRDELLRWVLAFPVATRNYLRGQSRYASVAELEGVLLPPQLEALGSAKRQPLFVIDHIRHLILQGTRSNVHDDPRIAAEGLAAMNRETEMLQIGMGSMERINATPLPYAYVAHLRTFLLLFLLGIPFVFSKLWGWATLAAVPVLSFGLLGIESAALVCERPFGLSSNHICLDRFCDVVAEDVVQSLGIASSRCKANGVFV